MNPIWLKRIRTARFVWKWRKKLWRTFQQRAKEHYITAKDVLNIQSNTEAVYTLPWIFLKTSVGLAGAEYCIEHGYKKMSVVCVNLLHKTLTDEYFFYHWIKKFPRPTSIDCIVAVLLKQSPEIITQIFDYSTSKRFHYYANALADFSISEYSYLKLLNWKHRSILERITHHYDPTFLCWAGLAFDRNLFDQHYALADHDVLVDMVENKIYFSAWDHSSYISFPSTDKAATQDFLCEKQREKVMVCVGSSESTKKRKM